MATASRAIQQIAEVTGTLPATVFRAARALREAGGDRWPQGSQGRGREAHVMPHHLVNLALALAMADPLTEAPRIVDQLRMLAWSMGSIDHIRSVDPGSGYLMSRKEWESRWQSGYTEMTLGDRLDQSVALAVGPDGDHDNIKLRYPFGSLKLSVAAGYSAEIQNTKHMPEIGQVSGIYETYLDSPDSLKPPVRAAILRQVTLSGNLFVAMSELYADTLRHRTLKGSKLAPTR